MKKLVLFLIIMMSSTLIWGQTVKTETVDGKTVYSYQQKERTSNVIMTDCVWKDKSGNNYMIYLNKTSGRCFVKRISSKTGNEYNYYLSEEICRQICNKYNIKYIEKK